MLKKRDTLEVKKKKKENVGNGGKGNIYSKNENVDKREENQML